MLIIRTVLFTPNIPCFPHCPEGIFGVCYQQFLLASDWYTEMTHHEAVAEPIIGLPGKYFTDHEIFRRAKENIFFRTWQYVCHTSQVPGAGDYFSVSIFDQDIFVVRGRDGVLRAFYNVCRHRGHKLLEGSGNLSAIVCPYHAWSYELNGNLRAAPNAHNVAGFNRDEIHLSAVALEQFLGFVFVNLDAEASPMDQCYPDVREAAVELCPNIETLSFASEHSVREGCNWLIAVENYNECYHCKNAHPGFISGVVDPETYNIAPFGEGRCLRHTAQATAGAQAWYDMSDSRYAAFYLWPAFTVQVYPGAVVNSHHWRPLAIDDTEVHRSWYSVNGEVDAQLQTIINLDRDTTFAEDLKLVKNVQRGVNSRGFVPGPLMIDPKGGANNELSIAILHRWVREMVE